MSAKLFDEVTCGNLTACSFVQSGKHLMFGRKKSKHYLNYSKSGLQCTSAHNERITRIYKVGVVGNNMFYVLKGIT